MTRIGPRTTVVRPDSLQETARRLARLRLAFGLSQAELCRRTGISTTTWNNYEKAYSRSDLEKAFILVRTFGVTLDWIYLANPAGLSQQLTLQLAP